MFAKVLPIIVGAPVSRIAFFFLCMMAGLVIPPFACCATLSISDISGAKGDMVTATLSINNAPNTARAFMLDVKYDVTCLSFQSFSSGTLVDGAYPLFTANNVEPGIVRLGGVASVSPGITTGSSGTVVALTFKVTGDKNSDLQITNLADDMSKEGWTRQNGFFSTSTGPEDDGLSSGADGNDGEAETLNTPSDSIGGENEIPPTSPPGSIPKKKSDSALELHDLMGKYLEKSKADKNSSNAVMDSLDNKQKQRNQQTEKRSIFHKSKNHPQKKMASQTDRKNTRDQLDTVSLSSRMSLLLNQQQRVEIILWLQLTCLIIQIIVLLLLLMLLINKFNRGENH